MSDGTTMPTASEARAFAKKRRIEKLLKKIPEKHREYMESMIRQATIEGGSTSCMCYPDLFKGEVYDSDRVYENIRLWLNELGYKVQVSFSGPYNDRVCFDVIWGF